MVNERRLEGFSDSDWENDTDTRKSVTGYVVFVNGNPLSWVSRSQKNITLASAHDEYNAISELCKEILYVKYIMDFLTINPILPAIIHCDNSGAIFLSKNHETKLSKHLDIKVHFIRSFVEDKTLKILFVRSEDNLADSFTNISDKVTYMRNFNYMNNMCDDAEAS